jgi:catechol 2,3-dioxygenase-like lactoylglutathione lyase family enzyme
MPKIDRSYVIDFAVGDFDGACRTFGSVFGLEGVRMNPEKDPSGELDGMHFPVGGVNAVGIMTAKVPHTADSHNHMARFLATHGDGINILGHLVDDIDGFAAGLVERGIQLTYPTPMPYEDGRLIVTHAMHGVSFEFAQHHGDQVTDVWKAHYDENPGRRVLRATRVDVVVDDLDAATHTFSRVLGLEPSVRTQFPGAGGSVTGVDFAVGGLRALGLVAVSDRPGGAFGALAAAQLTARGEGGLLMGFEVADLANAVKELRADGVDIALEDGAIAITNPLHGVAIQLEQAAR